MGQRLGDESDIEVEIIGEPLQGVYLSHVGEDGAFGDMIYLDGEEATVLAMTLLDTMPNVLKVELIRFVWFLHDEGCRIVRAPLHRLPPGSVHSSEELIQRFIETSNVDWYKLAQEAERGKERTHRRLW